MEARTEAELAHLKQSLHGWALGDVKRAAGAGAPVGAFILAAHFIDALARLTSRSTKGRPAWEEFVPKYMPRYGASSYLLYQGFRNTTSHHYSAEGIRFVDKEENRDRHWAIEDGDRVLHLESFIEDLDVAWQEVWAELAQDEALRERVLERARLKPPLGVHGTEVETSFELAPSLRAMLSGIGATHFSAESASAASWPTLIPSPELHPKPPPRSAIPKSRKRKRR